MNEILLFAGLDGWSSLLFSFSFSFSLSFSLSFSCSFSLPFSFSFSLPLPLHLHLASSAAAISCAPPPPPSPLNCLACRRPAIAPKSPPARLYLRTPSLTAFPLAFGSVRVIFAHHPTIPPSGANFRSPPQHQRPCQRHTTALIASESEQVRARVTESPF